MLKKNNIVTKSNVLNELRCSDTSLIEYRLFCIYLSRVNPLDETTKVVEFTLSDYAKIMNLQQPRKEILERQARNICQKTVKIEDGEGGFSIYSLFAEFKLAHRENEWFITLECNHKLVPHLFHNKKRFFQYKLWNTLYLKSYNQQRLYELLKQYVRIGKREISLMDLREYLSIGENEYPVWGIFSRDVLKVAQKAFLEKTDIWFEYETIKSQRKVVAVCFIIHKNVNYKDPMSLDQFLENNENTKTKTLPYDGEMFSVRGKDTSVPGQMTLNLEPDTTPPDDSTILTEKQVELQLLNENAFDGEFNLNMVEQLELIASEKIRILCQYITDPEEKTKKKIAYFRTCYLQMKNANMNRNTSQARCNYLSEIIKADINTLQKKNQTNVHSQNHNFEGRQYDLEKLEQQLLS